MTYSLFPILRIKPRINRVREQPYSTTWLLKSTPKRCVGVLGLCDGFRIVFDEPGEEFGTVNLLLEHLRSPCGKGCLTFIGFHCHQCLYSLAKLLNATLSTRFYSVSEFIFVFQFAEIAEKNKDVTKAV